MSAYEIRILDEGCRVQATQTGMFITQPSSFATASRKAAELNISRGYAEFAPNDNDRGGVPIPVLDAELLVVSGCIEDTTPIRGVDWECVVERVMSFAVGIVLGVGGVLLVLAWLR